MQGTRDECEPQTPAAGQVYVKNHLIWKHTMAEERVTTGTEEM